MKKILYVESNRDGTVGGSYHSLLHLVEVLDKTTYEPHILFCQNNGLLPEFRKFTPHVHVKELNLSVSSSAKSISYLLKYPYRFITRMLLSQKKLFKMLDEIRPDIVHLNNSYAVANELILACRLKGIIIIAHDRGTEYPCSMQAKVFARWLDAIICVSDHHKNNVLKQEIQAKRVIRIYDGIKSKNSARPLDHRAVDVRNEVGVPPETPLVGIVGNIMKWKGQTVVLEAISKMREVMPKIMCLIIGKVTDRSEGYFQELKKYIHNNDLASNIHFMGYRHDVLDIISQLDILLHASIEPEPFGLVILEGMSMQKPVIASNAGGPAEIVINGETGILVEPGNSGQMAKEILFLLENRTIAYEMGRKGHARFLQQFTRERMCLQIEQLYAEILNAENT